MAKILALMLLFAVGCADRQEERDKLVSRYVAARLLLIEEDRIAEQLGQAYLRSDPKDAEKAKAAMESHYKPHARASAIASDLGSRITFMDKPK